MIQTTVHNYNCSEVLRDVQEEALKRANRRVETMRQEWTKKLEAKNDENEV